MALSRFFGFRASASSSARGVAGCLMAARGVQADAAHGVDEVLAGLAQVAIGAEHGFESHRALRLR